MARMIDADVAIKRFRGWLESPHGENVYHSGYDDAIRHVLDVIDHMPTLTPPNKWVSVEERLPEKENAQVLMTDGEGCYISSRNNMVRFLDCEGIFIPGKAGAGVKVTHWMHLPQSPKEESL